MLLPEPKLDPLPTARLASPLDIPRRSIGPAEINPHIRSDFLLALPRLHIPHVIPVHDAIPQRGEQLLEIRASKVGPAAELGEGVALGADAVEHDVVGLVDVHALGEVGVDAEEVAVVGEGLVLEGGEQGVEPLEGGGVLADPDELDAAQAARRVVRVPDLPDVLQDRGPGGDADAGTDQDGDLVVEDVLGGGAVGAVQAHRGEAAHHVGRDLIDAEGVESVIEGFLVWAGAEGIGKVARPVADLADVDADVRIEGAGGYCERVRLGGADRGHGEEQPLAGSVFEVWGVYLDFDGVCEMVSQLRLEV